MKVEYEIQLTHVAKVAVEDFHKVMNNLQRYQLVVCVVNACYKVQTGIALIYQLGVFPVEEIAQLGWACQDGGCDVTDDLELFFLCHSGVPFCQPDFALPAEKQHELYLSIVACGMHEWDWQEWQQE